MKGSQHHLLRLEILWWLITLMVLTLILAPIYLNIPDFLFWQTNIIYIVSAITLTRFIFLLRFTFLGRLQLLKVAFIFLSVPFIFFLIQELNSFQTVLDEQGPAVVVGNLPYERQSAMLTYIYSEMLLFGVASIFGAILFPFRLIISIWRQYNNTGAV